MTIYYSSGDDLLPWSDNWLKKYRDPSYYHRLGLEGPSSYAGLVSNVCGVNCAAVINEAVIKQIPQVPAGTSTHYAYFYIPQVLNDWAQTLQGTAPAQVATARRSKASGMRSRCSSCCHRSWSTSTKP